MKKYLKTILRGGAGLMLLGMVSCTDYLEQDTQSMLDPVVPFRTFANFQSFTEELYSLVPDLAKQGYTSDFNWGEDLVASLSDLNVASVRIDNGNYMALLDTWDGFLLRNNWDVWPDDNPTHSRDIWNMGWYGISKANHGLANLDVLVDATDEQRKFIEGQLLFYRAFFHFQIIQYWGPMPYIDEVLPSDEVLRLPRPTYHEAADKIGEDFRRAADLLPFHWDDTQTGSGTLGFNRWRINKIMALGFLTRNYLWAASPLMNKQSTGSSTYDEELAKKAAAAAAELLRHVDNGDTKVALQPWESMIDVFYTINRDWLVPGGVEAIFQPPNYHAQSTNWNNSKVWLPQTPMGDASLVYSVSANYVNYYGMANGLPIDDPNSGYDPEYPWKDRDPRFYKDIGYDGVKIIEGTLPRRNEFHRHFQMNTEGTISYPFDTPQSAIFRDPNNGSRTGYQCLKWLHRSVNKIDRGMDQAQAFTFMYTYLRLADVYLMYAEAAAVAYGGANGKDPGYALTAADAINKVRERAGVGAVSTGLDAETFMSEVRRERAVELAFEGHRFTDLRRWLLLDKAPYNVKTKIEFERTPDFVLEDEAWTDSKENRVLNLREEVFIERKLSEKHYWLPIRVTDASLYEEFPQNPGW